MFLLDWRAACRTAEIRAVRAALAVDEAGAAVRDTLHGRAVAEVLSETLALAVFAGLAANYLALDDILASQTVGEGKTP